MKQLKDPEENFNLKEVGLDPLSSKELYYHRLNSNIKKKSSFFIMLLKIQQSHFLKKNS